MVSVLGHVCKGRWYGERVRVCVGCGVAPPVCARTCVLGLGVVGGHHGWAVVCVVQCYIW